MVEGKLRLYLELSIWLLHIFHNYSQGDGGIVIRQSHLYNTAHKWYQRTIQTWALLRSYAAGCCVKCPSMNRSCFGSNLCFHCLKLVELQKYNFYETFPFFVLSLYPVFLSLIFMYMLSTNIMMLLSLTLFLLASKTFKRFRQNVNEPSCSVNQTRGYAHIETVCNV